MQNRCGEGGGCAAPHTKTFQPSHMYLSSSAATAVVQTEASLHKKTRRKEACRPYRIQGVRGPDQPASQPCPIRHDTTYLVQAYFVEGGVGHAEELQREAQGRGAR